MTMTTNTNTDRAQYWYVRGRKDALKGEGPLNFDDAPTQWADEDVDIARAHYNRGFDSASMLQGQYAALEFEIREAEGLVAWATDPARAHDILAGLRAERDRLESGEGN